MTAIEFLLGAPGIARGAHVSVACQHPDHPVDTPVTAIG